MKYLGDANSYPEPSVTPPDPTREPEPEAQEMMPTLPEPWEALLVGWRAAVADDAWWRCTASHGDWAPLYEGQLVACNHRAVEAEQAFRVALLRQLREKRNA